MDLPYALPCFAYLQFASGTFRRRGRIHLARKGVRAPAYQQTA
jgi:hypothetical protein